MATCPEVTIQTIQGSECIGDSLPKINFNFNQIKNATCNLVGKIKLLERDVANINLTKNITTINSPTIKLFYDNASNVLSADAAFAEEGESTGFIAAPEFPIQGDVLQYNNIVRKWINRRLQIADVQGLESELFFKLSKPGGVLDGQVMVYRSLSADWVPYTLDNILNPLSSYDTSAVITTRLQPYALQDHFSTTINSLMGTLTGNAPSPSLSSYELTDTVDLKMQTLSSYILLPPNPVSNQVLRYNGATQTWVASASPSFQSFLFPNGYQIINSNLIIQWGKVENDGTTNNFPIEFPNACFSLTANIESTAFSTPLSGGVSVNIISKSQFNVFHGPVANPATKIYWMAMGW
jgi:hypothetical protein